MQRELDQESSLQSEDRPSGNFQKSWFKEELDQMRSEITMEFKRKLDQQAKQFVRDSEKKQREIDRLYDLSDNKQREIDRLYDSSDNKQREIDRLYDLSDNKQRDIDRLTGQLHDLSLRLNDNEIDQPVNIQTDQTQKGCQAN